MANSTSLKSDVQTIIDTNWNKRSGNKIPSTEDIALAGGAVEIDATFLYADLANSSKMAKVLDRRVAAKILKSFLTTTTKLIKDHGGKVVSFDGDRIMGVFYGDSKNTSAAKCALQITYTVNYIIKPKFEAKYDSVKNASFSISHGTGIDTGTVLAVRAGARGDNDLIWIGRAPSLAAKLSDLRNSTYKTYITASVYNMLHESSTYGGSEKKNMWTKSSWNFLDENIVICKSSWCWEP